MILLNKKRIPIAILLGIIVSSIVLQGCSSRSEELKNKVISYITSQQDVSVFGKVDLSSLIEKSKLESFSKIGPVAKSYIESISAGINLESPIYFTCSGPFERDGSPKQVVLFMDVLNKDSLINSVTRQGYDLNEINQVNYVEDTQRGFSLGITESMAILTFQERNHSYKSMTRIYNQCNLLSQSEKVDEILSKEGDIACGVSLQNLYSTSNTALNQLTGNSQKALKRLVANSYVGCSFHFEDGEFRIELDQLLNDKLRDMMFIEREDKPLELADHLGSGNARMGVSMNIDFNKLEGFISSIDPNSLIQIKESFSGLVQLFGIPIKATDSMSSLFTGQFGLVVLGEKGLTEGLSSMNGFIGLEPKGNRIASQSKSVLNGFVPGVKLKPSGISVYSESKNSNDGELLLPDCGDEFGQHGLDVFVDLAKLNTNQFEVSEATPYLRLIKSIKFHMTNEHGELVVQLKNQNNVLYEVIQTALNDLAKKIAI